MNSKKITIIMALVIGILVTVFLPIYNAKYNARIREIRCRANLVMLRMLVLDYAEKQSGGLPSTKNFMDYLTTNNWSDVCYCKSAVSTAYSYSISVSGNISNIQEDAALIVENDFNHEGTKYGIKLDASIFVITNSGSVHK